MMPSYRDTWIRFKESSQYKHVIEEMKKRGFTQFYADNLLQMAFTAGWGDRKFLPKNKLLKKPFKKVKYAAP